MPAVALTSDTSAESQSRRQDNVATLESFFAFMHAKDIDSWINLWADDGRILVPYPPQGAGFPPSIEGREQIRPGFQQLFAHFTSYDADVHTIYPSIDPDILIVEWSVEAHLDTGAVYRGDNITVFRFRDGKISQYHDYFNPELFRTVVQATSAGADTSSTR